MQQCNSLVSRRWELQFGAMYPLTRGTSPTTSGVVQCATHKALHELHTSDRSQSTVVTEDSTLKERPGVYVSVCCTALQIG